MQAGKSDRPWAEGYALGIVKSQYRRVIKPDGEEGYQTDGDVLRSAGRRSGKSPTAAPRKRAASVASTSRTRGRSKQSQSEEPQPKARSISADEREPTQRTPRSKTPRAVSKEAPARPFIAELEPGRQEQRCETTDNLSTVLDDDEGMVTPVVDQCLRWKLIVL